MRLRILSIDYHRNGVCGEGFHLVRFHWLDPESDYGHDRDEVFLGVVFGQWVEPDPEGTTPEEREGVWITETTAPRFPFVNPCVAILRTSDIAAGGLDMYQHAAAWRGDHFAPYLWRAIQRHSARRRQSGDWSAASFRPFTVKSPKPYRPRTARKKGA